MTGTPSPAASTPPPRSPRRWFRFHLRTLLVVMTVLGCGFGWVGAEWVKVQKEREIIEIFQKGGAEIEFRDDKSSRRGWRRTFFEGKLLEDVIGVHFSSDPPPVDDQDVGLAKSHLKDLTQLETLSFNGVGLTEADVKQISQLPKLNSLGFIGVTITNENGRHLHAMKQLLYMDLCRTGITPEAVKEIQQALPECKIAWDGR
jgi:hypothetical protein